jgi:hypothetical protein
MKRIQFSIVGQTFEVDCDQPADFLVSNNFPTIAVSGQVNTRLRYRVRKAGERFTIETPKGVTFKPVTDAEFLYVLEKEVTIEAQMLRPDLYFIHSAALEFRGSVILLIGESGAGKSTLTWALLHHGFRYLSDELAPVELSALNVHPYAHAICLKSKPPEPYKLPDGVVYTSHTIHIPRVCLPNETCDGPRPLRTLFFLSYDPAGQQPSITPISQSEGAARLYSNALNALAHSRLGLDDAVSIARRCQCFLLRRASADSTCLAVVETLKPLGINR